jgi:hypothetical protein
MGNKMSVKKTYCLLCLDQADKMSLKVDRLQCFYAIIGTISDVYNNI